MRLFDVNVLVYAVREELPFHARSKQLLDEAIDGEEPFALAEIILAGFVRVACHRKVFKTPTPVSKAIAFGEALRKATNAVFIGPGTRHWDIFAGLLTRYRIPGDEYWDAYLAALAIEAECDWVSFDKGFARFTNLKWINGAGR